MPLQRHNTYYDSTNPSSGVYYYDELGNILPLTIDKICHPGFGITFSANAIIATGSSSGSGGGSAYSPTVLIQDAGTPQGHPQGGTKVTITDINHQSGQEFYVWNGNNGTVNLSAGTDLKIVNNIVQVNTNGIANSAGSAFVEGINTVASGAASHAEGKFTSAFSPYSHVEGYNNVDSQIHSELIGANHTEGAYNTTSGVYAHVEGHANKLYGYGVHMQGGYNEFTIHNTSADRNNPNGRWNIWGQSIEGMANKTTSEPISGYNGNTPLYYHGGILKVIGNGTRTVTDPSRPEETQVIDRSDALILYRDGSMWVQGPVTTNKVFVSGTNFDTFGQSRLDGNNACYGTNWMGVSQSHAGFLKFIDGQSVGDTEISNAGSGIQIEFKPDKTQGELNIINTYAGTPTSTKVVNVPAASYTNMSTFDSENGPNYMLRKTANGFDIGAAVINTTALPENVQANAYYFIYEM